MSVIPYTMFSATVRVNAWTSGAASRPWIECEQSGESAREQGITTSGNRHVRWMTTELAWSWLRYQPASALSCWFRERFGGGGKRLRRIGMVAVARKLLIALGRFLEAGVLPEGAERKEA